jgi:type IV secretory pathway VirB2 component (pilin)
VSPEAILLAVASAVRPSTSLAALYALLSTSRPRPLIAAFVAGGFAFTMAVGVLVVVGLHGIQLPGGRSDFADVVDVIAGVAALGFASGVRAGGMERVQRRERADERSWIARALADPSLMVVAGVGVATHLPGLLYLVALNAIAADRPGPADAVTDIAVYNLIWFSLPLAALVFLRRGSTRMREAIERLNGTMRRHQTGILTGVFAIVGVFLLVKGIAGLAGWSLP